MRTVRAPCKLLPFDHHVGNGCAKIASLPHTNADCSHQHLVNQSPNPSLRPNLYSNPNPTVSPKHRVNKSPELESTHVPPRALDTGQSAATQASLPSIVLGQRAVVDNDAVKRDRGNGASTGHEREDGLQSVEHTAKGYSTLHGLLTTHPCLMDRSEGNRSRYPPSRAPDPNPVPPKIQ